MNSMKNKKSNNLVQQLVARIRSDTRSDSDIARRAGVSQPTVSRLRKSEGVRSRSSEPFSKLCSFYGIPVGATTGSHEYNELLRMAIIDAWDGTETHGRALLVVIKGLKGLRPPRTRAPKRAT
jgi:transcriptional regulator with XRE-family HTH domain